MRVGAPDPSLMGVSGLAAVTELCERLDVVGALDAAVGPIKARASHWIRLDTDRVSVDSRASRCGTLHPDPACSAPRPAG